MMLMMRVVQVLQAMWVVVPIRKAGSSQSGLRDLVEDGDMSTDTPTPPGADDPRSGSTDPTEQLPIIPEQGVPVPEQGVPVPEQGVPVPEQGVPGPEQSVPATELLAVSQSAAATPHPARGHRLRTAWGSTGGKIGIIGAGLLALVVIAALAGGLVFALTGGHRAERAERLGNGSGMPGMYRDHGMPGSQSGRGAPGGSGRSGQSGTTNQRGANGPGLLGLGAALHGEVVVQGTDGAPVTLLVQSGEVTAYTAGTSIEVKSTDGFTATYTISSATRTNGTVATGAQVRVVAAKDGAKATRITVTR